MTYAQVYSYIPTFRLDMFKPSTNGLYIATRCFERLMLRMARMQRVCDVTGELQIVYTRQVWPRVDRCMQHFIRVVHQKRKKNNFAQTNK